MIEHLGRLTADPVGVDLVAALCSGSRASFTIAEAADLLSVSAKHLYAVVKAQGRIAPGVDIIRSGDRMMIPAHQLRAFLRVPEPHLPDDPHPARIEAIAPDLLAALVRELSFAIVCRLGAFGADVG